MSKHKSTDRKLTAVKYYLKGKKSSWVEGCIIFNCSPKSLYRWVKRYKMIKILQRKNIYYQKDNVNIINNYYYNVSNIFFTPLFFLL